MISFTAEIAENAEIEKLKLENRKIIGVILIIIFLNALSVLCGEGK